MWWSSFYCHEMPNMPMVLHHDVVARANPSRSETVLATKTRESIIFNVRTQLLLGRESSWTWLWHHHPSSLWYSPSLVPCFHLWVLLNSVVKESVSIPIPLTAPSSSDVPTFGPQASTNNMCSLVLKEQFLMPPLGMSRFEI